MKRLPVVGKVTGWNGEEINGSISFTPAEGSHGPAATAKLVQGEYRFDESNGPTLGPYRVVVRRLATRSRVPSAVVSGQKIETDAASSASKKEWKLNADVREKAGMRYDFKLPP